MSDNDNDPLGEQPDGDGDPDMLAAEYVLGVLGTDEAMRCVERQSTEPAFARLVAAWEQRLAPLMALVPPVPPPAGLRERIEAALMPDATPQPRVVAGRAGAAGTAGGASIGGAGGGRNLRRQLWLWRGLTGASVSVACALALVLWFRPVPDRRAAVLLPPGDTVGGYLVQPVRDTIRLEPVRPPLVPAGRSMELWSLPAGTTVPHSLGVLPNAGETLPAAALPAGEVQLLISLEPTGGSPTGLPTGPVILAAQLGRRR